MMIRLFYLSLFFVVFEGIFRKWVFPSLSMQIFLLKYLVVFVLWIVFFMSNHSKHLKKSDYPYYLIGFLFITYALLDYFISYFSVSIWLVGMLSYFGFVIYMFVTPLIIKNPYALEKFIRYTVYITFVVILIGFIQFFLPPSHPLNSYAANQEDVNIATAGGMVRITSIFNYITGNSTYLSFSVPLLFTLSILERKLWKKLLLIFFVLIGLFDTFATGSRLAVFFILFSIGLIVLFIGFQRNSGNIKRLMVYGFTMLFIVGILSSLNLLPLDSIMSFINRVSGTSDSSVGRVVWMMQSVVDATKVAGSTGYGIGSTTNMALSMGGGILNIFNVHDLFGDQPMGRVIMEIGIVGFLLYMLLMMFIFFDTLRKTVKIKDSKMSLVSFTLVTTIIQYITLMNNTIFNWMGAVHFWLVIGLIIAMYHIDKNIHQRVSNG